MYIPEDDSGHPSPQVDNDKKVGGMVALAFQCHKFVEKVYDGLRNKLKKNKPKGSVVDKTKCGHVDTSELWDLRLDHAVPKKVVAKHV